MSSGYMGRSGDEFAGADPAEVERLKLAYDGEERSNRRNEAALKAHVEQLEQINAGVVEKFDALAVRELILVNRVEELEQALREAQANNDQMAYELGIHPDQQETT